MLTESIPVKHKSNETLGAGIIIGNEVFNSVLKNGEVKTSLIFLVAWENHPTITPHLNSELTHLVPVEDWYHEYFSALESSSEDTDHEYETSEEEQEQEHEHDQDHEEDNQEYTKEELLSNQGLDQVPVEVLNQEITNDEALNDASSDFSN